MSKKILIIDDEEGVRESLKIILADDYPLILTDGPEAGLDVLKNSGAEIGLVLLDIKMPHINGLDLLDEIKPFIRKFRSSW
jgi:DNA-binding NtrC family response regulator